jgi:hypothetical protein
VKNASGKFVIISIVAVALAAAGVSWWFRYNATHRAAEFWGPKAAQLIRDAPEVKLHRDPLAIARAVRDALPPDATESVVDAARTGIEQKIIDSAIDVSNSHGLTHLRNALLEDRNFVWPSKDLTLFNVQEFEEPYWWLVFQDPASGNFAKIYFSKDCRQAVRTNNPKGPIGNNEGALISTEPIAAGLLRMFTEMMARSPLQSAAPSP